MRSADLSSTWGLAQPPSYKQRQRWAEKWQVKIFLFIRKGEERKVPTETELQPLKVRFGGLLQPFCKFLLVSALPVFVSCPAESKSPVGGFWVISSPLAALLLGGLSLPSAAIPAPLLGAFLPPPLHTGVL